MTDDDDILAGLDWETPIVGEDVIDVSKLDNYDLSCLDRDTRVKILRLGEMHTPLLECSAEGRRLHTLWMACKVEMSKRRLPG